MSELLQSIIDNKNQTIDTKIVFVDVVSYSKRRSQAQAMVINSFVDCLASAREETAKEYYDYSEKNSISFKKDVITLPTGDGAAVCFPFEGLHEVHLKFALHLLAAVRAMRAKQKCDKYDEFGWCNCHSNFALSVGISDGKCIVYKDLNGNFNVSGTPVNMAARVMGLADSDQIVLTDDAYWQLIDLVDDPHMDERFKEYKNVSIKHGSKIGVYHYTGKGENFVDFDVPEALAMSLQKNRIESGMKKLGIPVMTAADSTDPVMVKQMMGMLEQMVGSLSSFQETEGEAIQDIEER